MPSIDQNKLIKILTESPATGLHCDIAPWQPNCWINVKGVVQPKEIFEQVSPTLYIDILITETVDAVDYIIEKMMIGSKDEWGDSV